MNPQQNQPDQTGEQPVAYDTQGRPLYLHPAQAEQVQQPAKPMPNPIMQSVHISRPLEPEQVAIPEHVQKRHEESCRQFPQLNLSGGEYIIISIKRHIIGLVGIWLTAFALIGGLFAVLIGSQTSGNSELSSALLGGLVMISVLILLGALVASYIYNQNRFYLTNESVIQEIQASLFSKNEQTVSLSNIEDASYRQDGIFAYMFNYGTIRLSTEGDETTYRFSFVSDPKKQIATLNNAVEAFKNGRPVEGPDQPS